MAGETRQFDVEETRAETVGTIGGTEVTITVEGLDETLVELLQSDLSVRADELKQMVDHDVPPGATEKPTEVDWEAYLQQELPGQKTDHPGGEDGV